MSVVDRNVFSNLAQHLSRSDENYLTQCLAACFNASAPFRRELVLRLASLSPALSRALTGVSPHALHVQTQKVYPGTHGSLRNILDAVVFHGSNEVVALEVKLHAPISGHQLRRYVSGLDGKRCPVVLLALDPDLSWIRPQTRAKLAGLSWLDVHRCAELAVAGPGRRSFHKTLLEEFMAYLESWDVAPRDPLYKADWSRITKLGRIVAGDDGYQWMGYVEFLFSALSSATQRLEHHRDLVWGELSDEGWTASSGLERDLRDAGNGLPYEVALYSAFHKAPSLKRGQKRVYEVWFGLRLQLSKSGTQGAPRLTVFWNTLEKTRQKKSQRSLGHNFMAFSPLETRRLFAMDIDAAHDKLRSGLRQGLAAFKRSRSWQLAR